MCGLIFPCTFLCSNIRDLVCTQVLSIAALEKNKKTSVPVNVLDHGSIDTMCIRTYAGIYSSPRVGTWGCFKVRIQTKPFVPKWFKVNPRASEIDISTCIPRVVPGGSEMFGIAIPIKLILVLRSDENVVEVPRLCYVFKKIVNN